MPDHTYTRGQQVTITATVEALDNTGAPYGGRSLVPFESIGVVRPADQDGDRVAELEAKLARVEALAEQLRLFELVTAQVDAPYTTEAARIFREELDAALAGDTDE